MAYVIDRYLIREVIHSWLWVTLVVWIILLGNQLVRYLGKAVAGDVPAQEVFALLGLSSVGFLVILLPLTLFLGIILALGRLYKDSEITALGACGIGTPNLYRPLLLLALISAAVLVWLSLVIVPSATQLRHQMEDQADRRTDMSLLIPGRFQELRNGKLVIYAERLSENKEQISNLFVEASQQGQAGLLTAAHAHMEPGLSGRGPMLVLEQGSRYQGKPGHDNFRVMRFHRHGIRLPVAETGTTETEAESKATSKLWGSAELADVAELQWRLSAPLAIFTLTLLAVPLSKTTPRQGQYGKVFTAVLVFIVYYNLLGAARVWIESGAIPPWAGLWWVHGLALLFSVVLLRSQMYQRSLNSGTSRPASAADSP